MSDKLLKLTKWIVLVLAVSILVMLKFFCGKTTSELLESHDLGDNRRIEVYHVMAHATVANYVDVYLIDKNRFVCQSRTLLKARMVGSVHLELISADTAMAYIHYYNGNLADSVVLVLNGDQETIWWR